MTETYIVDIVWREAKLEAVNKFTKWLETNRDRVQGEIIEDSTRYQFALEPKDLTALRMLCGDSLELTVVRPRTKMPRIRSLT